MLCGICVSSACWRCSFNTETLTLTNLCTKSLILVNSSAVAAFSFDLYHQRESRPIHFPTIPPPLPSPAFTLPSVSILSLWWLSWDAVPQLLPRDSSLFQGRQLITMTDKRPRQRRDHLSGRRRLNIPTVVLRAKSCESHADGLFTIYIKKKNRGRKKGGRKEQSKATKSNMHAHFLRR